MSSPSCPICFASPPRRAFALPCAHVFCDVCAARSLWDKPACAVCRAPASSAAPAWDARAAAPSRAAAELLLVRHRGVAFHVDLSREAHECAYARLGAMFAIPADRLKLVQSGRLLPPRGSPQLRDALRPALPIQLIGSRHEMQLPPPPSALRAALGALLSTLLAACHPGRLFRAAVGGAAAVCRTAVLFVRSLLSPQHERESD